MIDQGMTTTPSPGGSGGVAGGAKGAPAGGVDLLSTAEAAQLLGVSEADVQHVLDAGELAGKKIGATWRIKRSAIDDYLAK